MTMSARYIRHMLYELAFTVTRSVFGQCCKVKQQGAQLVAGWVTQSLKQGQLGSCAHAGYRQYFNGVRSVCQAHVGTLTLTPKRKKEGVVWHRYTRHK